jgi:hypothetical protein
MTDFRDALAKCDALIRERGGSVKPGYQNADWQMRWQAYQERKA